MHDELHTDYHCNSSSNKRTNNNGSPNNIFLLITLKKVKSETPQKMVAIYLILETVMKEELEEMNSKYYYKIFFSFLV